MKFEVDAMQYHKTLGESNTIISSLITLRGYSFDYVWERKYPQFPFWCFCSVQWDTVALSLVWSLFVERAVSDPKVNQTWSLPSNGLESKSFTSSNQLLICRDVILIRQVWKTVLHAHRAIKSMDHQPLAWERLDLSRSITRVCRPSITRMGGMTQYPGGC